MAVLLTPPKLQFFDNNGDPLAFGKVNTYTSTGGTFTTRKATFTTSAGTVENANPVILDAAGRANIWISGTYDFNITDANDVQVYQQLDVTGFTAQQAASNAYFESFSGTGAQTAFTTSADLGTDENAVFVWVDAGGGKGYDLQNPSTYTISGTTLTFSVAPASGTNNIYVSSPSSLVGAAASSAADAAASAAAALASESQAAAYAGQLIITSTTSVAIGTGSKVFTVASGLGLSAGQFILIPSDAAPTTNYMWGQITSYSSTTLTVTVLATLGSGTYADWSGYLTGERGTTGATGSVSDISGVSLGTPVAADTMIFTDISDSNNTKKATITDIVNTVTNQDYVLLSTQTASNDSEVEFTSLIDSTYTKYILEVIDLVPVTDNTGLLLKISEDNGSTYIGVSIDTEYKLLTAGVASAGALTNQSSVVINNTYGVGNQTTEGMCVTIGLDNPSNTARYKTFPFVGRVVKGTGDHGLVEGVGLYDGAAAAYNAVKLEMTGGNISSGIFKLYGIK